MELLYICIKDYRNVLNQGFNFSPRWRFSYNENSEVLDIDDNRDDIVANFFGENVINVTTIVGKNGTGKSNLVDFIKSEIVNFGSSRRTFFFVLSYIYKGEEIFVLRYSKQIRVLINTPSVRIEKYVFPNFGMVSGNSLNRQTSLAGSFKEQAQFIIYSNSFGASDFLHTYATTDLTTPVIVNYINSAKSVFHLHQNKYEASPPDFSNEENKKILSFFTFAKENNIELPVKIPDYFNITIDSEFIKNSFAYEIMRSCFLSKIEERNVLELFFFAAAISSVFESREYEYANYKERLIQKINSTDLKKIDFILFLNTLFPEYKNLDKLLDWTAFFQDLFLKENIKYDLEQIEDYKKWLSDRVGYANIVFSFDLGLPITLAKTFISKYDALFHKYNLQNHYLNFSWTELSTGEYGYLSFYARFYHSVFQQRIKIAENITIIIDEGDNYYHPFWQQRFLKMALAFFETIFPNQKIQVILTSHSPFVVSDLPKENIIFLTKDSKGYCQVADGLNEKKQTFGANIHTLLTDNFFMDGLIGAFAQDKINQVITFLNDYPNNKELTLKEAKKIVNMIGEPILKRHLQQQIKFIEIGKANKNEADIEALKRRITELEMGLKNTKEN